MELKFKAKHINERIKTLKNLDEIVTMIEEKLDLSKLTEDNLHKFMIVLYGTSKIQLKYYEKQIKEIYKELGWADVSFEYFDNISHIIFWRY